jgi:hypothetical protein
MNHGKKYEKTYETVIKRAKRYAEIQERLISPEGTFPAIGRSLPYRFGAFQLLAQMALQHRLYLCSVGLLPLGLPSIDPFWADAPQDWTSRKIWSGQNFPADHALYEQ